MLAAHDEMHYLMHTAKACCDSNLQGCIQESTTDHQNLSVGLVDGLQANVSRWRLCAQVVLGHVLHVNAISPPFNVEVGLCRAVHTHVG